MSEDIVECNPNIWIELVRRQIENKTSIVNTQIINNDSKIIYPLAYSLRKAAAIDRYFTEAMNLLFILSEYSDVFYKNMVYVMLPWYSQTTVTLDIKMGIIKAFFRRNNELAWRFITDLLPGSILETVNRCGFKYLPVGSFDVTNEDYKKEIDLYVKSACENIYDSSLCVIRLISTIPFLSENNAESICDTLTNYSVNYRGDKLITDKLTFLLEKKESYGEVHRKVLEKIAGMYVSYDAAIQLCDVFSYRNSINGSYKFNSLEEEIKNYYLENSVEDIVCLMKSVENKSYFAEVLYKSIEITEIYLILDEIYENGIKSLGGYIFEKMTITELLSYMNCSNTNNLSCLLECSLSDEIVSYVDKKDLDTRRTYWECISGCGCGNLSEKYAEYVLDKTMEYNNFDAAILVLTIIINKGKYDIERVFTLLEKVKYNTTEEKNSIQNNRYYIQELIGLLQNESMDRERVVYIELKYLDILLSEQILKPKFLFDKMANNPEFTYDLLCKGKYNNQIESSIYSVQYYFRNVTGMTDDGFIDYNAFVNWFEYARQISNERERTIMLGIFGKGLFYVSEDDDGFFYDKRIAEFIESYVSRDILRAFEMEAINSCGAIDVTPGSKEKEDIVENYNNKAIACEKEGFIKLAKVYRNIADSFEMY